MKNKFNQDIKAGDTVACVDAPGLFKVESFIHLMGKELRPAVVTKLNEMEVVVPLDDVLVNTDKTRLYKAVKELAFRDGGETAYTVLSLEDDMQLTHDPLPMVLERLDTEKKLTFLKNYL